MFLSIKDVPDFLRFTGLYPVFGQIIGRQLECIYVIWPVFLLFALQTLPGVRNYHRLREVVGFRELTLGAYAWFSGAFFFGPMFLTHGMFRWPLYKFISSMAFSWMVAAMPILFHLFRSRKRLNGEFIRSLATLFFLLHAVMTLAYVSFPFVLIE